MSKNICDSNYCMACGACENICPKNCVIRESADTTFFMEKGSECIECGLCEKICPVNHRPEESYPIKAYAAWSTNDKIRKKSASGGIATTIYECAFEKDVFSVGAYLDDKFACRLKLSNKKEDFDNFQNSKYTYSYPEDVYKQVGNRLKDGNSVIFIGLPCQIGALKNYLKVLKLNTENLIAIDIICHGTPMPVYLQQHIHTIENKKKQKYEKCFFRDAKFGTINFAYTLYAKDAETPSYVRFVDQDDVYQIGYHQALIYRDCCYNCQYAQTSRVGDLTIGDFHVRDVDECDIDIEDVSIILVNTDKGKEFFEILEKEKKIQAIERPLNEPIEGEKQLRHPSVAGKERERFVEEYYQNKDFDKAAEIAFSAILRKRKLGIDKIKKTIKAFIKSIIPRKIWSSLKKNFKK